MCQWRWCANAYGRASDFETLYAGPSSSLAADLLMVSGLVERVVVGYIGFEHIGLAPVFRRAVEGGNSKIEFVEPIPAA